MSINAVYDFKDKRWHVHALNLGQDQSQNRDCHPLLTLRVTVRIPFAEMLGINGAYPCTSLLVQGNNVIRFMDLDEAPSRIELFPVHQNPEIGEFHFMAMFRNVRVVDSSPTNCGQGVTFQPKFKEYTLKQTPEMNWYFHAIVEN